MFSALITTREAIITLLKTLFRPFAAPNCTFVLMDRKFKPQFTSTQYALNPRMSSTTLLSPTNH